MYTRVYISLNFLLMKEWRITSKHVRCVEYNGYHRRGEIHCLNEAAYRKHVFAFREIVYTRMVSSYL